MPIVFKHTGGLVNAEPRQYAALVKDAADAATVRRGLAAQANTFEALTLFAPSVALAVAAKANPVVVDGLSLVFVASRVAYNYAYVRQTTEQASYVRSAIWTVGVLATGGIWFSGFRALKYVK